MHRTTNQGRRPEQADASVTMIVITALLLILTILIIKL